MLTRKSERVDVLSVVGAGHVLLTETNGVLALGDTVEVLEVIFGDASPWEVDLDGLDTNVLGTSRHVEM